MHMQVKALHGRMKQSVRESTLDGFMKLPAGATLLLCHPKRSAPFCLFAYPAHLACLPPRHPVHVLCFRCTACNRPGCSWTGYSRSAMGGTGKLQTHPLTGHGRWASIKAYRSSFHVKTLDSQAVLN